MNSAGLISTWIGGAVGNSVVHKNNGISLHYFKYHASYLLHPIE